MTPKVSEKLFEDAIEAALLAGGPDSPSPPPSPPSADTVREPTSPSSSPTPYGEGLPGAYLRRTPDQYDRDLCLLPDDVIDFVVATQPKEWEKLSSHYGTNVRTRFLQRLHREIERRGTLHVLRDGIKDTGCKFRLAFFRPSSGLNVELERLYEANLFSVVRQLHYSTKSENSLDLALFLNGLPLFTAELKNPLMGQRVADAVRQYRRDRDPRGEPLLAFRRCLAHFAVDPDLVYVTTRLEGGRTRFLPFNQGRDNGAGNPPVAPVLGGYATEYLWSRIWAKDSVLNLVQHFVHEIEVTDQYGKKTGEKQILFPRYHQLDAVRRLVSDARDHGPGERYLVQHSAGSGKSNSIAWLAHQLSVLHDEEDRRVFDSIVVITDRRVLDRQLQHTVSQFGKTLGVVENIDKTSRQLKEALEGGKTIIVTTLQKFPVIAEEIGALPGKRFAVLVDEAHSSQSGESVKSLKSVLAAGSLEEAAAQDEQAGEDLEDRIVAEMKKRGPLPNLSTFAFTATPKAKTLELFGTRLADGRFAPFSLYSMRQAIEEKFILDVLQNYTTFQVYWSLLKKVEDDPHYDQAKASYLLRKYVDLHEHSIAEKVAIMVEHFRDNVEKRIKGRAKAMIVTRSRLHAVRTKLALDAYLKEKGLPDKALVAFSGSVRDPEVPGHSFTESSMNGGLPETQTARTFDTPEYRFLVVAEKFQTGFDQPLLHTMYVDKKLSGVHAVQTLSRLNRTHPDKEETMVLDFANEAKEIQDAFQPYYEKTLLEEATDPNLLYDYQHQLEEAHLFDDADLERFAEVWFAPPEDPAQAGQQQARLLGLLEPVVARFDELDGDDQHAFRGHLKNYVTLYAFLSQILPFTDADLEKLYAFARMLRRRLPPETTELPREVQEKIDLDSFRIQQTSSGKIGLHAGATEIEPRKPPAPGDLPVEHLEPLSKILAELNKRFGAALREEDRLAMEQVFSQLERDEALDASARVNTRENARLAFDHKVKDAFQRIVDSNFQLYKRIVDDEAFGTMLRDGLFDEFMRTRRRAEDLIHQKESKTLERKSTLRWNTKEAKKDDRITHAVLKTIAAFLNTEGGDLLIGVGDGGKLLGLEADGFESDDKLLLHLGNVVTQALGTAAGTCIDPRIQTVEKKPVCVVTCKRSPEPVFFRWKRMEKAEGGDLYVRVGPQTRALGVGEVQGYLESRWPGWRTGANEVSSREEPRSGT